MLIGKVMGTVVSTPVCSVIAGIVDEINESKTP